MFSEDNGSLNNISFTDEGYNRNGQSIFSEDNGSLNNISVTD